MTLDAATRRAPSPGAAGGAAAPATGAPACPFCESRATSGWGERGGRTIHACRDCGVVFFARPIDYPRDYDEYYPYLQHFDGDRFAWELQIRRRKYRAQLAAIRRLRPAARTLLDVGSGPGYLCKVAIEEGWQAQGVETSAPAIAAGERAFGVRYTTLDEVAPHSQDVITCHHVLEHIEEPRSFLATLHAKLRPDGLLVVHVPHCEPLSFMVRNLADRLRGRAADRHCQMYYPEHISGFDPTSLDAALARCGFEAIRLRTVAMWSRHYDPFFLRNYFYASDGRWLGAGGGVRVARHALRCLLDNGGRPFGRGDWVIGHFRPVALHVDPAGGGGGPAGLGAA